MALEVQKKHLNQTSVSFSCVWSILCYFKTRTETNASVFQRRLVFKTLLLCCSSSGEKNVCVTSERKVEKIPLWVFPGTFLRATSERPPAAQSSAWPGQIEPETEEVSQITAVIYTCSRKVPSLWRQQGFPQRKPPRPPGRYISQRLSFINKWLHVHHLLTSTGRYSGRKTSTVSSHFKRYSRYCFTGNKWKKHQLIYLISKLWCIWLNNTTHLFDSNFSEQLFQEVIEPFIEYFSISS